MLGNIKKTTPETCQPPKFLSQIQTVMSSLCLNAGSEPPTVRPGQKIYGGDSGSDCRGVEPLEINFYKSCGIIIAFYAAAGFKS
jgi:hypothetical protein